MPLAKRADRRAALGGADQRRFTFGSALLEPRQQGIGGGRLIDAAAALNTVAEVSRDTSQVRLREPTKGQRT
jgi:hypothetical protein